MQKNVLFIILIAIIVIALLSTAALCNMCGLSLVSSSESADDLKNDNEKSGDSGKSKSSASGSSDTQQQGGDKKDDKESSDKKSQNSPPEIISIKTEDDDLFTNLIYKFTCEVKDPDNDTISYVWSADGGTFDNSKVQTVMWTAPGFPETYHIKLEINDGKGGSDSEIKAVRVEEIQQDNKIPQNNPPVITSVKIESSGTICNNNSYLVWCYTDMPNDIVDFDFSVTGGNLHDQDLNNITWDTPDAPGNYSITVIITDINGNTARWIEEVEVKACVG